MTDQELIEREELLEDILDALEDGDIQEAEDLADEAIEAFPNEAFGYFYMAESMLLQTEYDEALLFYKKACQLAPDNSNYLARVALTHSKLDEIAEAKATYQKVLAVNEGNLEALVALGVLSLNSDELEDALQYLDKAIELDSNYADAYKIRVIVHQELEQYDAALADLKKALAAYPADNELWMQKISLHDVLGQEKEVHKAFEDWIQLDVEDTSRRIGLGDYLMMKEAYKDAEKQYSNAIEAEVFGELPVVMAFLNRGWARLRQNKLEEALADFRKVINLEAKIGEAYMGMAEAKAKQKELEAALTFIDLGVGIVVEDLWMLYNKKGEILTAEKNWEKAKEAYEMNIQASDELSQSEGYFGLGKMYQAQGDLKNALGAWRQAEELFHIDATEHIEQYCQDLLAAEQKENEEALLNEMAASVAANSKSKLLSAFYNQLWKVDLKATIANNEIFKQLPKEMEKQILGLLENVCMGMNAQGVFVGAAGQPAVRLVFSIDKETASSVSISGIPLNGSSKRVFTLEKTNTGLVMSGFGDADADIPLTMVSCKADELPTAALKDIKAAATAGDLDYLGDSIKSLL